MIGPLMCWDIFMNSYYQKLQLLDSLQRINRLAKRRKWKVEWDIEDQLLKKQKIIIVTDPSLIIRFASSNLVEMNGYNPDEVLGKSPKIFQGNATQTEVRIQIKEAIVKRMPFHGSIINYKKNGTSYNCIVEEYPVWNSAGTLVNFIAFEEVA